MSNGKLTLNDEPIRYGKIIVPKICTTTAASNSTGKKDASHSHLYLFIY
jgi:hypothetical protein